MTKLEAVRSAIADMERKRRVYSKDRQGLIPVKGMEEEYQRVDETIRALKDVCQALQAEGVKASIAAWQQDLIEKPEETIRNAMGELETR